MVTEYLWRAPVDHHDWQRKPVPLATSTDALAEALQELRLFHSAIIWCRDPDATVRAGGERAMLFERGPGRVHVVGIGTLAAQVRFQLQDGEMPGWRLYQLPEIQTLLEALRPRLSSRYYGLLHRNDFATVEEIAATPGAGLLAFRNAGPKFLASVRQATATLNGRTPASVDDQVAALAAPDRGVDAAAVLDTVDRVRYAATLLQTALVQLQQSFQPLDASDAVTIPGT